MIRATDKRAQQIVSGFKSPADDYLEGRLDVNDLLVVDPHSTFYFKASCNAMASFNIVKGALLIVDRSLPAVDGAVVIACVGGELLCRGYLVAAGKVALVSDEGLVELGENGFEVWGVVMAVCNGLLPKKLRSGRYADVCAL